MNYTREQVEAAYVAGAKVCDVLGGHPKRINDFARDYVNAITPRPDDPPPLAPEASAIEQTRSPYLPPNGTPEEVLARAIGTLMFRCSMFAKAMQEHEGVPESVALELARWFNEETWFWPTMNALRTAFPILGALEDARIEEVPCER